jgi:hypothetical protein
MHLAAPGRCPKATVGASNNTLPPHYFGIAQNPLGHQLRVLNEIGGTVQNAWNEYLILG